MRRSILKEIILKKKRKIEFAVVTNLDNAESFIFEPSKSINKNFLKYKDEIISQFNQKSSSILKNENIFVEVYIRPIKVLVVGAVHIAQYLVNFAKHLNLEIIIIDPRGYFASKKRFPDINIINKWPEEALKKMNLNKDTALIALTHDPKIDDPALQYALKNNFFYIGALGSKKTHENRCKRLRDSGFTIGETNKIYGPIGIKLGGRSAPEIALSIISQLILEIYKKK